MLLERLHLLRKPPPPPPEILPLLEQSVVDAFGMPPVLEQLSVYEVVLLFICLGFLILIHLWGRMVPMNKTAVLNLSALNRVNIFKECFLGYVNAGMLEPILAIASADYDVSRRAI